jgi:hypothetical protein
MYPFYPRTMTLSAINFIDEDVKDVNDAVQVGN